MLTGLERQYPGKWPQKSLHNMMTTAARKRERLSKDDGRGREMKLRRVEGASQPAKVRHASPFCH